MGLTADSGGDFLPAPAGTHVARCIRIIDLGTQPGSERFPKQKHKVQFVWELPNETVDRDGQQFPQTVSNRFNVSMHENATLRKVVQGWLGKKLTEKEAADGYPLTDLLGQTCMISVSHSADGKWANVDAVMALPPGTSVPAAVGKLVKYEAEEGDCETFQAFNDGLKITIAGSPEFRGVSPNPYSDESAKEPAGDSIPF